MKNISYTEDTILKAYKYRIYPTREHKTRGFKTSWISINPSTVVTTGIMSVETV